MTETQAGRKPVQFVALIQPKCARIFGVAPCLAASAPDQKCYNTRATCQDSSNFSLGDPLRLIFSRGNPQDKLDGVYVIPSLVSVSTTPTKINLAAASQDAKGLGNRSVCTLVFQDHPHTDRVVDPYLSDRTWDPMDPNRGSFWSRWIARNKYKQQIQIVVYEGYAGQDLAEMVTRTFFLDSVSGPDSGGRVRITGKDILARVEERKAQAPLASPGVLYSAIDAGAVSMEVSNAVVGDYPAIGTVRIGDEILIYQGLVASVHGVLMTGLVRGTDGTQAQGHAANDGVQECLRFVNTRADHVQTILLRDYAGVEPNWLDVGGWAQEFDQYLTFYTLSRLVTKPTPVLDLVSEVSVQAGHFLWWDERAALVRLKAVRGIEDEPALITDDRHILAGSFSLAEKPRERISRVVIYFARRDYTKPDQDPAGFSSQFVIADLESETDHLYGEKSIRTIYASWLDNQALAQNTASKIITRYVDVPTQCRLRLDAKDRAIWVGDTVRIRHFLDVDAYGAPRVRNWTIVSAEEVVPGETVEYLLEDTTLYGRIHFVMPDAAPDYAPGAEIPFRNCYIGDANGFLSDGTPCGRIS